MPFKFIEAQRHYIPKGRHRVQNWPDYDRSLERRGDTTKAGAAIAGVRERLVIESIW